MAQTDKVRSINRPQRPSQPGNVFRVALILLGAAVVVDIFYFYLAFQLKAWQMFGLAWSVAVFILVLLVSLGLLRRGYFKWGVGLMLAELLIIFPLASVFIKGLGLILALGLVLFIISITAQILPRRPATWLTVASVAVGVITFLLDLFGFEALGFTQRLVVPQLRTFIPAAVGVVVVIYAFFIARQYTNYSLRAKLIIAFLVISILAVGVVAFTADLFVRDTLTEGVGANLKSLANSQGLAVGDILGRQVNLLQSLSLHRVLNVEIGLFNANAAYLDDPAAIRLKLEELDQQWLAAGETDLVIQSRLINVLASELTKFRDTFPDHSEVFVTNQYGALIAATNRTSDYYQADEVWWQAAYNDGLGAVYIGEPELDESSNTFGIGMAVPIYAANGKTVIGILRSTYRVTPLLQLLAKMRSGQAELFLPGGRLLAQDGTRIELIDLATLENLEASAAANYGEFQYKDTASLVSQAPVTTITDEPVVTNLGWRVIAHRARNEALAPVQAQQTTLLALALGIALVTTIIAVIVAQLLSRPITRLTAVAQQVAGGDLLARAYTTSGDEIGKLAAAFNAMTDQLRETIGTLEERVADRTQQLETVVEISQRLAGILDLSDLLRQVVNSTKETFNYYHVHIYLLDDKHQTLLMAEGYGEAGSQLKAQGHSILLNSPQSLVARAAREGRVIIVDDVHSHPDWLPNPLLPETRSEMVVPVKLGAEVVGVLDVQSEKVGGLTQEDEATLQALANQVAVAVRNARLFTQTQEALYEAQKLQHLYTGQAWEKLGARHSHNYEFRQAILPPLPETPLPEAIAALQQEQTVELKSLASERNGNESGLEEPHNALATPLKLRDQVIGVLGIHSNDLQRQWTTDEIALIEAVSEQMSLAIENARLFDETGRRAGRERMIADVTQQVWASGELERVMQTVVEQLGLKLDASKVVIRLGTEEELLSGSPSDHKFEKQATRL